MTDDMKQVVIYKTDTTLPDYLHYEEMQSDGFGNGQPRDAQDARIKALGVKTVVLENDRNGGWSFYEDSGTYKNTHRITFETLCGEPDLTSVKMEKIDG